MSEKTLVDEIIENARRDRKRLEAVAAGLTRGFDQTREPSPEGEQIDAEVSAAFAEEIAKISDSLTKVNQQLVELVKVDAKRTQSDVKASPTGFSKKDAEDVFEKISRGDEKEIN